MLDINAYFLEDFPAPPRLLGAPFHVLSLHPLLPVAYQHRKGPVVDLSPQEESKLLKGRASSFLIFFSLNIYHSTQSRLTTNMLQWLNTLPLQSKGLKSNPTFS